MRMKRGWIGCRAAALTLGLLAAVNSAVLADSMTTTATTTPTSLMGYSTSGQIGVDGISGPNVISFSAVPSGSFEAPSSLSLGEFLVAALPAGISTTYTNTPFTISYIDQSVDGNTPGTNQTPITVSGVLNGTVTGPSQSSVVATFNPIPITEFQTGNFQNILSLQNSSLSLVPSTTNGGQTTAQAQIIVKAAPVPEPATIAIFLTAIAGVGLRRRFRASV
jgi:hypothetical protein